MKNLKYFPYERNRYFFGKLMTVADFDAEQRYGNDKRRLQNRLLHGVGVVCGLNVVQVDDTVISLEPGVALDALGREIVVDTPVIKKLSMIQGFDQAQENATLYLLIEYDEEDREPVYSVAGGSAQGGEGINHNKIGEGYRLLLTDQEPDTRHTSFRELIAQDIRLVDQNGVRISLQLPRYVRPGELFDGKVIIEKRRQTQPVAFQGSISLTCATDQSGNYELPIAFDEAQHLPADRYEQAITLRAATMKDAEVGLAIVPGGFHCRLGERELSVSVQMEASIQLCAGSLEERVLSEYTQMGLDDIASSSTLLPVVLARIQIVGATSAYAIDRVDPLPFGQLVVSSALRSVLDELRNQEFDRLKDGVGVGDGQSAAGGNAPLVNDIGDARCGFATIEIPSGAKAGDCFYTKDLVHGLGLGHIAVQAGLAQAGSGYQPTVFGDATMFGASQGFQSPVAQVAALTQPDKGTFVIGCRLQAPAVDAYSVTVRWWAFRDASLRSMNVAGKSIAIRPDMAYVAVRESLVFETIVQGLPSSDCTFTVKEPEGGLIEPSGKYTAPGQPGVYEIVAQSLADPTCTASAFVVVREKT